ncbi:hypothetical protein ASG25_10870 [Rhizobium sp. Leaf384]|uniref:hypothetical protein n=1 Tax=Rhizobium sp. Leaf384 TaxID=1736358 RepID=UPI000712E422|nr:hypothetical protein [Rhizobium sp. Leaf384]KQS79080.1 hypothetical protein ASG25_10870 [Rhizobium sp. Leaf384]
MTDPKYEPVAWNELVEEIRERGNEIVRLASTVEALTAQVDALKEENERLKAIRWVRLLAWTDNGVSVEAITAFGFSYRVFCVDWEGPTYWMVNVIDGKFVSEAEAKAAAQTDYETRIMSALTQPQLPESGESVEGSADV